MPFPGHPPAANVQAMGGGIQTPLTILGSKLVAWWNADDTALITIATGVSSWKDSIAAIDAVQGTALLQPVVTTWLGAVQQKGVTFDATVTYLRVASTPASFPVSTSTSEIWLLVSQDLAGGTAGSLVAVGYGNGNTNTRLVRRTVSAGVNRCGLNAEGTSATNGVVDFSGRHYVRADFVNGAILATVDNTAGTSGAPTLATTTNNVTLGASTATIAASFFGGVIAQVLVLNAASTAGERTSLNAYFAARL